MQCSTGFARIAAPLFALALALVPLAACGDDDHGDDHHAIDAGAPDAPVADAAPPDAPPPPDATPTPDATPPDFSCMGMDPPTGTVPDPLVLMGIVESQSLAGSAPVSGGTVEGRARTDDSVLATAMTDMNGAFTLSVPTGGMALDGYLRFSGMDLMSMNLFNPDPLQESTNFGGGLPPMFSASTFGLLAQVGGASVMAGKGHGIILVEDCSGNPIQGATVMTAPPGTVVYTSSGGQPLPDGSATSTGDSGVAFIFNVNPGNVAVSAMYGAMPLQVNNLKMFADQVTVSIVHP